MTRDTGPEASDSVLVAGGFGRFGSVDVGFETQKRTIKDSGHWWRDLIAKAGGEPLGEIEYEEALV